MNTSQPSREGAEPAPAIQRCDHHESLAAEIQRILFEQSRDAILVAGGDGRYVDANPAALTLLGYERDELLRLHFTDVVPPGPTWNAETYAHFVRQGTWEGDVDVRTKTGSLVPTRARTVVLHGDHHGVHITMFRDVSDRNASEAARSRLAALVSSSADAIIGATRDGTITDWNPAAERLYGYTGEDVIDQHLSMLAPPEEHESVAQRMAHVLGGESIPGIEDVRWTKDGQRLEISLTASPIRNDAKQIVGISAIVRDISALKATEAALRGSEIRFRTAFANAPIGMALVSPDGEILQVNAAFCVMLGYSEPELVGRHFQELTHPDDLAANLFLNRSALAGARDSYELEKRYVHKEGHLVWAHLSASLVRDDAGTPRYLIAQVQDITARKAGEGALRHSEARFRSLIANATDIISILGSDGEILYVSPPITRFLGYDDHDLVGRNAFDYVHPDDLSGVWTAFERALADPTYQPTVGFRFLHADGSWHWLESTGTNLLADGDVGGFVVNSRDVTARVEAETDLGRERDLSRALMEHLPDAVYIKDTASRFLRLNPVTARNLGIADPADALGKTDFDFFPETLARRYFADEQQVMTTGKPLLNQIEPQSENGVVAAWWLTSTVPMRDATGAVVGLVGSVRDITERLRTEAALRESEVRHSALLAALPDMVFRLDRAGTILDYKADRLDDLALPPEEFLGRTVSETLPADVAEAVAAGIARVLETGSPHTVEYALELDRGRVDFEARLVAAGSDGVVAVVRDITDRKRFDEELQSALQAAHAANHATRQFLTMMSHELRTPMQAIMGYAELLLAGPEGSLTPEQADDVRTIRRGANRLVDLVKQMLDLSRLDAGQIALETEPVALAAVIDDVRQDVAPQAAAKAVTLRIDLPDDLPPVQGDAMGIHQILLNLVGNAVKFTEAGEVCISAQATDDDVAIAVRDTGIGIAADALPHIFEEFHQLDSGMSRRHEGAGLGLTIARKLAELMGGRLTVESRPGRGSTFSLHLHRCG